MRDSTVALALIAIAAACSGIDSESEYLVRDSSGITIVESRLQGESQTPWFLEDEPVMELGVAEGDPEYMFDGVSDIELLENGTILIAQNRPPHLRLYDENGRFMRAIGREGDGPGEFRAVGSIDLVDPTSVVIFDSRLQRVTKVGHDGQVQGNLTLDSDARVAQLYALGPAGYLAVGQPDLQAEVALPQGVHRSPVPVTVLDSSGRPAYTVGTFPANEMQLIHLDGMSARNGVLWGRSLSLETRGTEIVLGTGETFEVRYYAPPDGVTRIARVLDADLRVDPDEWLEAARTAVATMPSEEIRLFQQRLLDQSMPPDGRAPFTRFVIDDQDRVWLSPYEGTRAQHGRWHVLDVEGRLIGTLEVPDNFRIFAVQGSTVIGRWRGDLDVEYIRIYRFGES